MVVKKDGRREPFDRAKIIAGLKRACEKRPVSMETIDQIANRIEAAMAEQSDREVASNVIGAAVMNELHKIDQVAYVRFASVYRSFKDIDEFMHELEDLINQRKQTPASRAPVKRKATAPPDSATLRDERFMREALALARERLGFTTPNPSVGCVIVRGDKVVGRGVTGLGGRPHGEAVALAEAGARARGATAYVSFEPCAHFGQTPPCADALVAAGVKRVVIGCVDPDPRVRGRGIAILKRAKIEVTAGVLEAEAMRLNEGFITRVTYGRPLGMLKLAMSLDGRIAAGERRFALDQFARIARTGASMASRMRRHHGRRRHGHRRRSAPDVSRRRRARPGARRHRRATCAPRRRRVFTASARSAVTILVTTPANLARARARFERRGVEVIAVATQDGEIELEALDA